MDIRRNDITRISELPEAGSNSQSNQFGGNEQSMGGQPYKPLNIHTNPYGIPEPTDRQLPSMSAKDPNPRSGGGGSGVGGAGNGGFMSDGGLGGGSGGLCGGSGGLGVLGGPGPASGAGGAGGFMGDGVQSAPPAMMNRGVPQDTASYQQDEQVVPNYVPMPKLTTDYLREYEEKLKSLSAEHQKAKHLESLLTSVYDEMQIPILIGVMFFMFQMPFINSLMFKYLSFMKIYNEDGNLNFYGMVFKSIVFGLVYFGFIRITTHLA